MSSSDADLMTGECRACGLFVSASDASRRQLSIPFWEYSTPVPIFQCLMAAFRAASPLMRSVNFRNPLPRRFRRRRHLHVDRAHLSRLAISSCRLQHRRAMAAEMTSEACSRSVPSRALRIGQSRAPPYYLSLRRALIRKALRRQVTKSSRDCCLVLNLGASANSRVRAPLAAI